MGTSVAAAVLSMVYRFYCIWENKRRDKTGTLEGYEHGEEMPVVVFMCNEANFDILAYDDDLTDRKVYFFSRYTCNNISVLT